MKSSNADMLDKRTFCWCIQDCVAFLEKVSLWAPYQKVRVFCNYTVSKFGKPLDFVSIKV